MENLTDTPCNSATPNKAPPFNASTEYYTTMGGPAGPGPVIPGPVTTPPLMAYQPTNGYGGPQRGTVYSQPVSTSPNYHPYRRQL